MELVIFKSESEPFNFMWEWLQNHPINEGLSEPKVAENQGQAWEYMGTFVNGEKAISDFRHRCHPATNDLYKVSVEHPSFNKEDIDLSKKIK
jgi:hypothetical protein